MSFETFAYHSCRDTGDADRIEKDAPYHSAKPQGQNSLSQTFLSPGYYFWEEEEDDAHWWGEVHYQPNYVVLECHVKIDRSRLLDLAGNPADKRKLRELATVAISRSIKGYTNPKDIPVGALLDFIRGWNATGFPFDAARTVDLTHSQGGGKPTTRPHSSKFPLNRYHDDPQYILCIFKNVGTLVTSKKIVYPTVYTEE